MTHMLSRTRSTEYHRISADDEDSSGDESDGEISNHEWSSDSEPDSEPHITAARSEDSQVGSDQEDHLEEQQPKEQFVVEEQSDG